MTSDRATPSWHTLPVEAVFDRLDASPEGLSGEEAARRLARWGPNELQAPRRVSPWAVLTGQLQNVLILILLGATVLSFFLGHQIEAIAIAVIVTFAVLLGFVQEYRAERALEALGRMAAPMATVLRDGAEVKRPARELVVGDVVLLATGDKVAADARLTEAVNLHADEAALTGESVPVEKHTAPLDDRALTVGDRTNTVHAGTAITYGRGRGVVVATAMATEFGAIARMLETVETPRTPLQVNLDRVGHTLARAALVVVVLVVLLGMLRGQPFVEMLLFGIALAVAVVPEALPAVVTISLAIGVRRMVRRHALVRRLPAVETLGSTSVICSDKTGTLTRDEMTVRRIVVAGESVDVTGAGYEPSGDFLVAGAAVEPSSVVTELLRGAALASDATIVRGAADGRWQAKGDPTEAALVVAAAKCGLDKADLDAECPRVHEIPFSSETKRMTTVHAADGKMVAYAKGAAEIVLASCRSRRTPAGDVALDAQGRAEIEEAGRQMATGALRVLAVAAKADATVETAERDMTFLGLIGMIDPPRPEAKAAVERCAEAGIKAVMITGDHPLTAAAVARELGLLERGRTVTGAELDAMNDEALASAVEDIQVYARVSPAHKLRVVDALQRRGHIAAMTGDGVNDAPALKKADIGIAMGITGTDVTKEAAVMTLTDDNFASIVAAVEEGRAILGNIKKYLSYLLSANVGELGLIGAATVLGLPLPLTAVQILYVNLATDGLPALALSVDPPDEDLMRRPPRDPRRGLFTPQLVTLMAIGGIWSAVVNLLCFLWVIGAGHSLRDAMTMTFVSLVLLQFFKAYSFRSERPIVHRPFANWWLNAAVAWEIGLLGAILYVPFLQAAFGTYALSATDWVTVVAVAASIVPVLEMTKWVQRRMGSTGSGRAGVR